MMPIYYIGKRTLGDIVRSAIFWGALAVAGFVCFALIYWGWRSVKETGVFEEGRRHHRVHRIEKAPESGEAQGEGEMDLLEFVDPRNIILWYAYGTTIGFGNLLGIFIMMGAISRDIEQRRLDLLLARPVSRGQIYFGKLIGCWVSLFIFLGILTLWAFVCMVLGGMKVQPKYVQAVMVGSISPLLMGSLTMFLSLWMRGILAGFIATIANFGASTAGIFMIHFLGTQLLKLDKAVMVLYKILPPLNVIGEKATSYLSKDLYMRLILQQFEAQLPKASGLYTEMWQVWVYFGVVLFLGWLSIARRQFT